jgi:hypothetical protein
MRTRDVIVEGRCAKARPCSLHVRACAGSSGRLVGCTLHHGACRTMQHATCTRRHAPCKVQHARSDVAALHCFELEMYLSKKKSWALCPSPPCAPMSRWAPRREHRAASALASRGVRPRIAAVGSHKPGCMHRWNRSEPAMGERSEPAMGRRDRRFNQGMGSRSHLAACGSDLRSARGLHVASTRALACRCARAWRRVAARARACRRAVVAPYRCRQVLLRLLACWRGCVHAFPSSSLRSSRAQCTPGGSIVLSVVRVGGPSTRRRDASVACSIGSASVLLALVERGHSQVACIRQSVRMLCPEHALFTPQAPRAESAQHEHVCPGARGTRPDWSQSSACPDARRQHALLHRKHLQRIASASAYLHSYMRDAARLLAFTSVSGCSAPSTRFHTPSVSYYVAFSCRAQHAKSPRLAQSTVSLGIRLWSLRFQVGCSARLPVGRQQRPFCETWGFGCRRSTSYTHHPTLRIFWKTPA